MMKHLEDTDKAFGDNMSRLSGDMDKLTGAITAGFSLLQKMLFEPSQQSVPMPADDFPRSNRVYYPQPAPYQLYTRGPETMPSNPLQSAYTEATEPATPKAQFEGPQYRFN